MRRGGRRHVGDITSHGGTLNNGDEVLSSADYGRCEICDYIVAWRRFAGVSMRLAWIWRARANDHAGDTANVLTNLTIRAAQWPPRNNGAIGERAQRVGRGDR